jgi:hypothetical protein
MKAKSIIIAAVLALQINVLLADNNNSSAPAVIVNNSVNAMSLAPATPMEATFEESVMINEFADLAPVLPQEASFDDIAMEAFTIDNGTLAPLAPSEASFE